MTRREAALIGTAVSAARRRNQTHCKRGHSRYSVRDKNGCRRCLTCNADRMYCKRHRMTMADLYD